jgi:uncharacterized protein YbjT (DUF2867 family)
MILVTGATGNVGRKLVEMLGAAGEQVRAVSRTPQKAGLPAGVEVVAADLLAPETLGPALQGVDRVFLLLHLPGDPAQAVNFARAAAGSDLRRIVMFSSGTVERPVAGDTIGESHRRAEADLRQSGKPLTFLRPGTLMFNTLGWAAQVRAGDVVQGVDIAPAAIMDEADVAAAAAAVLTGSGEPKESYQMTGPDALSAADQVRILSEVLGRKLSFAPLPTAVAAQYVADHIKGQGDPLAVLENVMGPNVVWARPNGVFEALTGRKPGTFRQWVEAHAEAFR